VVGHEEKLTFGRSGVASPRNGYVRSEEDANEALEGLAVRRSEFHLPPRTTAPALARATVASAIGPVRPEVAEQVELLTSEVVTNAIRHSRSDPLAELILRVDASNAHVRIEVLNAGPSFDPPVPSPDLSGSGLGLFLVDALAEAWGVDREGPRTKVWFEISKLQ
jgi:anti-sigma regulatory factor (Ser/Thr protein kinase)